MIADILNLRVEKMQSGEGPAFGAAILAMVGAGQFASVEEACQALIRVTDSYEPNPSAVADYDARYPIYTSLYASLKDSFDKMASV
jgi:xylulokinase